MQSKKENITETEIQNRVWYRYINSNNLIVIPNTNILGWESDILVITRALYVHEFEIKLTRADFLVDEKKDKFKHFEMWMNGKREYEQVYPHLRWNQKVLRPPNYFWYVCPPDVIKPDEIPVYAGLYYVRGDWGLHIQKSARKLHKEKIGLDQIIRLCRNMTVRYWDKRLPSRQEML